MAANPYAPGGALYDQRQMPGESYEAWKARTGGQTGANFATQQQTSQASAPAPAPAPQAAPTPPPTPIPLSEGQKSAKAIITGTLTSYGLGALGETMWQQYLNGDPLELIWLQMVETPEYKSRFPGMDALRSKGRAISEAQYIEYERNAIQIMRAAGIPPGVMDSREKLGGMIGGEVSLKEFEDRLNDYQSAVFNSPQEVRDQLRDFYVVQEGDMLGFFLDPEATLPMLEKKWIAAQAGGTARAVGYGELSKAEAERLGELGLDRNALTQGFGALYSSRELFLDLPGGENEGVIDKDTQFGAAFEGREADRARIERRAAERKAKFGGGGNFAGGQGGISGLGSAN